PCLSVPLNGDALDPTALSGYTEAGNFYLGLTRGSRFRRVLRSLTLQLRTALEHLTEGGTLVVQWRGVAHHPTLLFLLRGLTGHFSSVKLRLDEEDTENLGSPDDMSLDACLHERAPWCRGLCGLQRVQDNWPTDRCRARRG
ncbi:hypothetical protein FOZ63_024174, partial [Perkinsus olseni]